MGIKKKNLIKLNIPNGPPLDAAKRCADQARAAGVRKSAVMRRLRQVVTRPEAYQNDPYFADLAAILTKAGPASASSQRFDVERPTVPHRVWGEGLDDNALTQFYNACSLPVAVQGALMPDAHVGYGLPIGGVLATRNAVIPYAVGVDIACRMKMTVLDLPIDTLDKNSGMLRKAIEAETRFGIGAAFKKQRREHAVMDRDWSVSPITRKNKDKAWSQLGTSGSGNHFVEFGVLELDTALQGLPAGRYLALLSHSGSRGAGAQVCQHYSKIAQSRHRDLPNPLRHLAWLDLDSPEGREYWSAMQLMGEYAAANHACIHRHIAAHLGAPVLLDIENHHNFAWIEEHQGERLVVHRKGATPAGDNVLGIIPGAMASPAYIVRGRGEPESLSSAAHGAGRVMSRRKAHRAMRWHDVNARLQEAGVTLMSAGLDEAPMVYKDIDTVMAAQRDLVTPIAKFHPRLVKMAPAGERPED